MATWYGFNPPWFGGPQVVLSRQEDERLIKNDILQLLLTLPGERIHRPDFGCNLRIMVFEPFDTATELSIIGDIKQAMAQHEPRVTNVEVLLERDIVRHTLYVNVLCRLKSDPNIKLDVELTLNAPGVG